jgi:hypothetical protein
LLAPREQLHDGARDHRGELLLAFDEALVAEGAMVPLRVYLAILPTLPIAFVSGYRAIAFLCWVPNLVLAELLLGRWRQAGRAASNSSFGRRQLSDSAA